MYFQVKNTLKSNRNHTPKQPIESARLQLRRLISSDDNLVLYICVPLYFFNVDVRVSLCVPRLIPRALKLTIM